MFLAGLLLCFAGAAGMAQVLPVPRSASTADVTPGRLPAAASGVQAVSGRVVSAADGHPIANATVTLNAEQRNASSRRGVPQPGQSQTAQTDSEGRFRLPPQPAGRYALRASAAGYLGTLYLEHEGFSSAIVIGAGVPTDDLRFTLVAEASLHGRVLDDTGEPVRATMMLFRDGGDDPGARGAEANASPRFRPAGSMQADDDGRYEFQELQPGRYYIAANATPWYAVHARPQANEDRMPYRTSTDPALDVAYPITFYPHATAEAGATPIVLKAGQRAAANLLMQAEHAVTLTVQLPSVDAGPQSGIQRYPVLFQKVFGNDQASGAQMSGRVGDALILSGIAPGQYEMRSFGRGGNQFEGIPVNLSTGSATVAMQAGSPSNSGDVLMALRTSGGAAISDAVEVELQRIGSSRNATPVFGKAEQGSARITGVEAGDYRVRLRGEGTTWNVSRLTVNGKVVTSKVLHVDGSSVSAEVVCTQYSPEVDGTVHAADGKPHAGSLVVLVPAGTDTNEDLFRADQSDLDGGFHFAGVLPGNYLLVAIDNDWKLNWHDPAALMPYLTHALPVTVAGSGPRQVTLHEAAIAQQR